MLIVLLNAFFAAPITLGVAEAEDVAKDDLQLIVGAVRDEVRRRTLRPVQEVQIRSSCAEVSACASEIAKEQLTDQVILLRVVSGPLRLRIEADRWGAPEGTIISSSINLGRLELARLDAWVVPLVDGLQLRERVVSTTSVPDRVESETGRGDGPSIVPWLLVSAGMAASFASIVLAVTAPRPLDDLDTPTALTGPEYAVHQGTGAEARTASGVLAASAGALIGAGILAKILW